MRVARALQLYRVTEGIGLRDMAKEIGIHFTTLHRIENGESASAPNVAKLISWLFSEPGGKARG